MLAGNGGAKLDFSLGAAWQERAESVLTALRCPLWLPSLIRRGPQPAKATFAGGPCNQDLIKFTLLGSDPLPYRVIRGVNGQGATP